MGKVQISANKCERCNHIWRPRNTNKESIVCPKCKSPYWNIPRKGTAKINSTGSIGHKGAISSV